MLTAAERYGVVALGAGPSGAEVMPVDTPTPPGQADERLVGLTADPTFWYVAMLGAVIGLAALSAER